VGFLYWFVDELVVNLMKYTCRVGPAASGLRSLPVADLIQVESRVCRPQWVIGGLKYRVVLAKPRLGLDSEPLRVLWKYADPRSRIGCDVCLSPLELEENLALHAVEYWNG